MNFLNSETNITGRLGQTPEYREPNDTHDGVLTLSVATNDYSYKDEESGEWKDQTEWHPVVMFGKLAQTVYKQVESGRLDTGAMVQIKGQYREKKYENSDGDTRYSRQLHCGNYRHFNVLVPANKK